MFNALATPEGLDKWWTKHSSGKPLKDEVYELNFGAGYDWKARVSKRLSEGEFEFEMAKLLTIGWAPK